MVHDYANVLLILGLAEENGFAFGFSESLSFDAFVFLDFAFVFALGE